MTRRRNQKNGTSTQGDRAPGDERATVRTIEGLEIEEAELTHIAPHFRIYAVPVSSLKRDPENAREHGEDDLPSTAKSLADFGQQELIQYERDTRVVKIGNGRHEAAERILGWKYIAAAPSNLSPERLKAFALVHNRTAEKSRWNWDALQKNLDEMADLDVDLSAYGFSGDDLQQIEADLESMESDGGTIPLRRKPRRKEGAGGGSDRETWGVFITCRDEKHQRELIETLTAQGLDVEAKNL